MWLLMLVILSSPLDHRFMADPADGKIIGFKTKGECEAILRIQQPVLEAKLPGEPFKLSCEFRPTDSQT